MQLLQSSIACGAIVQPQHLRHLGLNGRRVWLCRVGSDRKAIGARFSGDDKVAQDLERIFEGPKSLVATTASLSSGVARVECDVIARAGPQGHLARGHHPPGAGSVAEGIGFGRPLLLPGAPRLAAAQSSPRAAALYTACGPNVVRKAPPPPRGQSDRRRPPSSSLGSPPFFLNTAPAGWASGLRSAEADCQTGSVGS